MAKNSAPTGMPNCPNEEAARTFDRGVSAGIDWLLSQFFGASSARLEGPTEVNCLFAARCGTSEEKRTVEISAQVSPEENSAILQDARDRKRWYENQREKTPGLPPLPPAPPQPELDEKLEPVGELVAMTNPN